MSHPEMSVNSAPGPSTSKRPRHRLHIDGVKLLDEYWRQNLGTMPSPDMRHALTEKIRQTSGHEYYTFQHTSSWFRRKIDKWHETQSNNQEPSTLPKVAVEHLTVLIKSQPNPPPDVVKTWASMLASQGAAYQDVVNWVNTTGRNINKSTATTRLPTPANTASPSHSPSLPPSSPVINHMEAQNTTHQGAAVKRELMHSPMLAPLTIPIATQRNDVYVQNRQGSSRYSPFTPISVASSSSISSAPPVTPVSPARTVQSGSPARIIQSAPRAVVNAPGPTSPVRLAESYPNLLRWREQQQQQRPQSQQRQQSKRPNAPVFQAIIHGVADAASAPTSPTTTVPSSAAEFNQMFAPYEKQMAQLMQSLEHS